MNDQNPLAKSYSSTLSIISFLWALNSLSQYRESMGGHSYVSFSRILVDCCSWGTDKNVKSVSV